jgi:hypothetical protein
MNRSPQLCCNGNTPNASLEELGDGRHERCSNPHCRDEFSFYEGKFQRVRGVDARWYCDTICASGPYLTRRSS